MWELLKMEFLKMGGPLGYAAYKKDYEESLLGCVGYMLKNWLLKPGVLSSSLGPRNCDSEFRLCLPGSGPSLYSALWAVAAAP